MSTFSAQNEYITWRWWEEKVFWKDDCPFCDSVLQKDYIQFEGNYWKIIQNRFPYSATDEHLMIVPIRHVCFSYELTSEEASELPILYQWMKDFYGEKDYFSCTRETMPNRSVEHLHMHFLPGKMRAKVIQKMLQLQWFPIEWEITF